MSDKLKVTGGGYGQSPPSVCIHREDGEAKPVTIGDFTIWAGGGLHLTEDDMDGFDLCVNLREEKLPEGIRFGQKRGSSLYLPIRDFSVVADRHMRAFGKALMYISRRAREGTCVLIFCAGGHGRTGLVLSCLLAANESEIDDPVTEIRRRYCPKAVETRDQRTQVEHWHAGAREAHAATAATKEGTDR